MEIEAISRIGFGSYRVDIDNELHYQALAYALQSGCNLVETSSNYTNGGSEALIGKVLSDHPAYDPFVITKAGYIQNDNFDNLRYLHSINKAKEDLVVVNDNLSHSIHPDFLANQLSISQARLKRSVIDGFLLHNPEYHSPLSSKELQQSYYSKIKKAFTFLEDQVSAGTIRYYGVSSNTLSLASTTEDSTSLLKLIEIASQVSSSHHFKIIEFPLNLVENKALQVYENGESLVSVAKRNNIKMLSNRPLNAKLPAGTLRLATYPDDAGKINQSTDIKVLEQALELANKRLKINAPEEDLSNYPVVKVLQERWQSIENTEAVDRIFNAHFFPFIMDLYEEDIPESDQEVFLNLYSIVLLYARRNMTVKALAFRKDMEAKGVIAKDEQANLPALACQYYLESGIDCVLVGMKNPQYVDDLKSLF